MHTIQRNHDQGIGFKQISAEFHFIFQLQALCMTYKWKYYD